MKEKESWSRGEIKVIRYGACMDDNFSGTDRNVCSSFKSHLNSI